MNKPIKNRVRYSPNSSQAIGEYAGQQRLAYNAAIEYTLQHPNVSKYDTQHQLTLWRQAAPDKWSAPVAVHRPGLYKGRESTRKFHKADARILSETIKELDNKNRPPEKSKPPKHGNNKTRNTDPKRLFKSRRGPITLTVEDATVIKLQGTRTITAAGLTVELAKPVPPDTDVRALQIRERPSSIKQGRNRPLEERSYNINLIIRQPDPEPKNPVGKTIGLDAGVTHVLTDSEGNHHDPDIPRTGELHRQADNLTAKQKGLKRGGRQWKRIQKQLTVLRRTASNIRDNWEHHTAKHIAEQNDVVITEKLGHAQMRPSARGTPENPGTNVRAKSGLNRSLARARPGTLQAKLERHCEKTGTWFLKVDPRYTSQTCSNCGYRNRKNRKSQAEFRCLRCLTALHSDVNAAVNVEKRGRQLMLFYLVLCEPNAVPAATKGRRRVGIPPSNDSPGLIPTLAGSTLLLAALCCWPSAQRPGAQAVRTKVGDNPFSHIVGKILLHSHS